MISRRQWLAWAGAGIADVLRGAAISLDHLLEERPAAAMESARYIATANLSFLGVPLFSRAGVGEGYARIEVTPTAEGKDAGGREVKIEFAAGSLPDRAHGLNKLGFIRESVMETQSGARTACAYFGFMTTSQEKSLDEGKKALGPAGETLTYSVGCGMVSAEEASGRTMRINLPSRYGWRDRAVIAREARQAIGRASSRGEQPLSDGNGIPATFLYAVHKAMVDGNPRTEELLIFNGRYFTLRTEKQRDDAMAAQLAKRSAETGRAGTGELIRLKGILQPKNGGNGTSFRVWFQRGSEHMPPLRFDYQARSFLRLTFEGENA